MRESTKTSDSPLAGDSLASASCFGARQFELEGEAYAVFELPLRRLTPPTCLSAAEREVVLGVLNHWSNKEIASARRTSVRTVANQLRTVYVKLGISGRSELIETC